MASGYPDYEGGKQRLYLVPEWAAKESKDKTFAALEANAIRGVYASVTYVVPEGKTLYITQVSAVAVAVLAAESDKPHTAWIEISDADTGDDYWEQGCDTGFGIVLPKPIVLPAGTNVVFLIINYANHTCSIYILAAGYEV
jgi:hypothetical protein